VWIARRKAIEPYFSNIDNISLGKEADKQLTDYTAHILDQNSWHKKHEDSNVIRERKCKSFGI
jgi:hypothetical protein